MGTFVHGIRSRGSGTAPTEKIVLHSPLGSRRFNAHDDAGSLTSGLVVYRTGTTQANDMTVSNADHGQSDNESVIYVVEIVDSDIHKAQNWDLTTAYSANDPIIVRELQYGDQFWAKGSTLTVVEDTCYFLEANGLWAASTVAAGTAVSIMGHACVADGAMTSGTWFVATYLGVRAYDHA